MMNKAQEVLNTYWDGSLPINVREIARRMGINVVEDPSMDASGMIEISHDDSATITIKSTEFGPRQSFTLAHEIGHYALGHVSINNRLLRDEASNFMTGTFQPVEREANQFAAALLMPAQMLQIAIKQGHTSITGLARLFGVSEVAMKWRLVNLKLINE